MKRPASLWVPLALLSVGAAGVALLVATRPEPAVRPPETAAPLVRVVEVAPEPVRFVVHAQGTVMPRTESELVSQVAGEVVWVSPALVSGGFFETGDPLLRLDTADYEADLETARAEIARARSEHARARKELRRQRRLAAGSVASEARIDDAENAFQVAEAALRAAGSRLARAERDLDRTELRAPYAGRVRQERVDVGQFVSRGTSLATLYAIDYAEVRLPVPDRELRYVDIPIRYRGDAPLPDEIEGPPGPEAQVAPLPAVRLRAEFAGREHVWQGRVVRTEGEIDSRTRMVNVVARVEDPYAHGADRERPPLAVGLFVTAEILGRELPAAVVLPRSALRESLDGVHVLVVETADAGAETARLVSRPVEVLRTERERVVIGSGLAAGERVCVSALRGVVDGMQVRVVAETAALASAQP
ncbi:MAG: efflux RND transporter periplasmic adaptor subunit [Myxococcota bacterium]|nr:efflux RND transporter periplasmic adaptor subunit [Myxococcota bacterium]